MSPVAERIYEKIKILNKEKDELHDQITKLKHTLDHVKQAMHHTEWQIALEDAPDPLGNLPDVRLGKELRELYKERNDLHNDERLLKDMTIKYDQLTKKIDDYRFWMHRADSVDPVRQREAEKKIFG